MRFALCWTACLHQAAPPAALVTSAAAGAALAGTVHIPRAGSCSVCGVMQPARPPVSASVKLELIPTRLLVRLNPVKPVAGACGPDRARERTAFRLVVGLGLGPGLRTAPDARPLEATQTGGRVGWGKSQSTSHASLCCRIPSTHVSRSGSRRPAGRACGILSVCRPRSHQPHTMHAGALQTDKHTGAAHRLGGAVRTAAQLMPSPTESCETRDEMSGDRRQTHETRVRRSALVPFRPNPANLRDFAFQPATALRERVPLPLKPPCPGAQSCRARDDAVTLMGASVLYLPAQTSIRGVRVGVRSACVRPLYCAITNFVFGEDF